MLKRTIMKIVQKETPAIIAGVHLLMQYYTNPDKLLMHCYNVLFAGV